MVSTSKGTDTLQLQEEAARQDKEEREDWVLPKSPWLPGVGGKQTGGVEKGRDSRTPTEI